MKMDEVLKAFGLTNAKIEAFGTGLINRTWKVYAPGGNYILQKINDHVFRQPKDIAHNIRSIADHLQKNHPDYFFIAPVVAVDGNDLVFCKKEGWFRLMPFAENSITCDVVQTSAQAYEAAKQFGRFTRLLSDFDAKQLKVTIPQFHDLELRYRQFGDALSNGDKERIREAKEIIVALQEQKKIVDEYKSIIHNPQFKLRVTHHDTKISNVLFDQNNKGLCVIDLDTVMPGYFISDVGDMMRTYLSPVSEEENDFDKILVRSDFYKAIVEGYSDEMKDELTKVEKNYFLFAGKFMIYMQALRFLTDYFNNDVYYRAKYEGHNLVRAKNQATLLQRLVETEVTA
jgi:Ser/Thr protein kinase RdoA (MazF antagonist)